MTESKEQSLSEKEAKEQRKKVDAAKKSSNVSQQKVRELTHFVDNLRSQRARFEESARNLKEKLAAKDKEIADLTAVYNETHANMVDRKAHAARLKQEIRNAEKTFASNIEMCRKVAKKTDFGNKDVTARYTSKCMAAERGYDCKPGSTHGHLSKTLSRTFF